MSASDGRPRHGTPGRKGKTGNQYFDVGKVGRKTGITLKDTGIRDDHGLEPVSGIFSSPAYTPRRQDEGANGKMSPDIGLQGPGSEDDPAAPARATPRLPPARASPFKRTQISGSPRRQSSAKPQLRSSAVGKESEASPIQSRTQPPANRKLEYGVRASIEPQSPFRPKRTLRRSVPGSPGGGVAEVAEEARNPFVNGRPSPRGKPAPRQSTGSRLREVAIPDATEAQNGENDSADQIGEDADERSVIPPDIVFEADMDGGAPVNMDDDDGDDGDYHDGEALQYSTSEEIDGALGLAGTLLHTSSPATARKGRRSELRQSGEGLDVSSVQRVPPVAEMTSTSASRKRDRRTLEKDERHAYEDSALKESTEVLAQEPTSAPSSKRPRKRQPEYDDASSAIFVNGETDENIAIDPALLAHGDSYAVAEGSALAQSPPSRAKASQTGPNAASRKPHAPVVRRRGSSAARSRSTSRSYSPSGASRSESTPARTKRAGTVSNVHLRASTPFEDAGQRTSRAGRPIMKPLKHWAGEGVIWKHGEVDGVIRANAIEPLEKKAKPRRKGKTVRRGGKTGGKDAIDGEEGVDDELLPDVWEEEIGVLSGDVGRWDAELGVGSHEELVREDIAFASSSIITREVAGSAFTYAKIQTLPFFGSGIVELPPAGSKRVKNSRKMQMSFFVHKGKVFVEIRPPAPPKEARSRGDDVSAAAGGQEFTISEGGAWIVPRGNNYSIANVSNTKSARIFFSQGCEIEPEAAQHAVTATVE